jgi:hypothetical protein
VLPGFCGAAPYFCSHRWTTPTYFFLALVIAGMCAGAATVHAAHFPSVIAFILPSILPLTTNLLLENSRLHIASGVMAGRLRSIVVSRKPTVPDVVP